MYKRQTLEDVTSEVELSKQKHADAKSSNAAARDDLAAKDKIAKKFEGLQKGHEKELKQSSTTAETAREDQASQRTLLDLTEALL